MYRSWIGLLLLAACDTGRLGPPDPGPWASELVSFEPGEGAGFGSGDLPEVVLGPPVGHGPLKGSMDVLSLGMGGQIVLGFDGRELVDGPGVDLIVFENAFYAGGEAHAVWAEPAEVALSEDGEVWSAFPCDPAGSEESTWPGCAGWQPTEAFDVEAPDPLDHALTGGDGFDLADLGLDRARFVRITDLGDDPTPPSAGFDLDALGAVHIEEAE